MTFHIYYSPILFILNLVCPLTNSKCLPEFVSDILLYSSLTSSIYTSLFLVLSSYLLSDFPCKFPYLHTHSLVPKHSQNAHIPPLLIHILSIPLMSNCLIPRSCTTDGPVAHNSHIPATKHSPAKHSARS